MKDLAYWQKQFEAYIAQWSKSVAIYRQLPEWSKQDCASAMKAWVGSGLVKEKNSG